MGLELIVRRTSLPSLAAVLSSLEGEGLPCSVVMVDGALQPPGAAPGAGWRELRVKTPAGMVTLRRSPDGIALLVFGNADPALQQAQARLAAALEAG